ncbi:MAG TPA: hypothetical protein VHF70_09440 [Rubrobacteraceae bacterium]|jgi:hypothetical protein|nr:hypothetical protein [Rubrobacteraceae bacterium]
MRPGESSTVEGVTAATRADAMLLMASQFDEHKVPIAGDALDAAGAGLLDGTRTARATHRVSEAEVMELHGMGPKALDHLRRALAAKGQRFDGS